MTNSIEKGKRGERLWAAECRKHGYQVRRGKQYSGLGGEDCIGLEGVWQEIKFGESVNIQEAMKQAVTDSSHYNITHQDQRLPIVALKKKYRPWRIIMQLPDLTILYGATYTRDLSMILLELSVDHWFKIYDSWLEAKGANT